MVYFILRNFVLFFWDFNGGMSKREDLQMVVMKSEENTLALLKTESTTDILVGQVDKFQNSCFEEHMWKVAAA